MRIRSKHFKIIEPVKNLQATKNFFFTVKMPLILTLLLITLFVCKMAINDVSNLVFPKIFSDWAHLFIETFHQCVDSLHIKEILSTVSEINKEYNALPEQNRALKEELSDLKYRLEIMQENLLPVKEEIVENQRFGSYALKILGEVPGAAHEAVVKSIPPGIATIVLVLFVIPFCTSLL